MEVRVRKNGKVVATIFRPLQELEGKPAIAYRKQLWLLNGNPIEVGGEETTPAPEVQDRISPLPLDDSEFEFEAPPSAGAGFVAKSSRRRFSATRKVCRQRNGAPGPPPMISFGHCGSAWLPSAPLQQTQVP